jgi:putative ABC transport system substrate-binding protein
MRRRDFITFIGGAAVVWPLAARAQQSAMPVIGFLNAQSPESWTQYVDAFRNGLKESGYVEGQNIAIEFRWARGRFDALPLLAAELTARRPAVIVASGGDPAALAAKAATSTIPVVFLVGGDPVQQGLVASFNFSGGNITGVTMLTLSLEEKRLGLLRELLPQSKAFAFLTNPGFPGTEGRISRVKEAARAIGLQLVDISAANEAEIDKAFSDLDTQRAAALLVAGDPFFNSHRDKIVALAAGKSIPAIYEFREFAIAGGLMSYGTQLPETYRQLGRYTGRVLKGEGPSSLPILRPTKFELVINLKTAKALGLSIPTSMQLIADEMIE